MIKYVSPEEARHMLDEQRTNRAPNHRTVAMYARLMQEDMWKCDPLLPIVIDEQGKMLDGQHRMLAVIASQKTIPFFVSVSDKQTVDRMSQCRTRKIADRMVILDGVQNATIVAAASKLAVIRMKRGLLRISQTFMCSMEECEFAIDRLAKDGIDINSICVEASRIYRLQHHASAFVRPTDIAYSLIDGHTLGESMVAHLEALCDEQSDRTVSQSAVRKRLLGHMKATGRYVGLYCIMRSFNDPDLKRIEIGANDRSKIIEDAVGGYFSRFAEELE